MGSERRRLDRNSADSATAADDVCPTATDASADDDDATAAASAASDAVIVELVTTSDELRPNAESVETRDHA